MKKSPSVYIILLNWNGWADSIECLESVFNLDYDNYKVVLCDNDSQDNSIENIKKWANGDISTHCKSKDLKIKNLVITNLVKPIKWTFLTKKQSLDKDLEQLTTPLTLIQTGENLGFAGGNNVGLEFGLNQGADFCWLLNNDTVVEPDSLREMVNHSEELRKKGIKNTCGSVQCFYDDPNIIQALGGFKINRYTGICSDTLGRYLKKSDSIDHEKYEQELDAIQGCSWLIPKEFIKDIGLMEHKYFLYFEEVDWITRSKNSYAMTYSPKAIVYHKEGSSIGSKSFASGPSVLAEFYTARARIMYMKKFYKIKLPLVYLSLVLQAINRIKQRKNENAKILLKVILGKRKLN